MLPTQPTPLGRLVARTLPYRLVYELFTYRLTLTGQVVFWVLLASTSISLFSFILKSYFLWSALVSLSLVSIVCARLGRVRLHSIVHAPERARVDQSFQIEVVTENPSRRTARDVRMIFRLPRHLQPTSDVAYLSRLASGESHTFRQQVTPSRRGAYLLDQLYQESCYPFGLWRDHVHQNFEQAVLVYPKYHPLRELDIPVGMRYQPGGLALTSHLGDSTEFLSTREFRVGDPLRHIHWRSWARLGKPIVKEYGEEYFCRLALIIDTVLPNAEDPDPLEQAISLAAAITDYLSREEYVIDIFAAGPKLYYLQAGRSLAYLQNILDVLACLEPTPRHDESFLTMETTLLEEIEGISTTILIFTDWDARRQRLLDELQHRGTSTLGFLVAKDQDLAQHLPDCVRWLSPDLIEKGIDVL